MRQVISLLDKLKQPLPTEVAKQKHIKTNKPPSGKWRCHQVQEFSSEPFTISGGHLFCQACR